MVGEKLVEKRGWHWALTSFTFESWGGSERNVGEEISEGDWRPISFSLGSEAEGRTVR